MLTKSRTLALIATCLALPQTAAALEVGRCNIAEDGMFRTVLVVRLDGATHIHRAGQDGLTRRILFNPDAAADWALARYGAGPAMDIATCAGDGHDTVACRRWRGAGCWRARDGHPDHPGPRNRRTANGQ